MERWGRGDGRLQEGLHRPGAQVSRPGTDFRGRWGLGGEGGGVWLLDPKMGIHCETDRESCSGQPVKVAHIEGAVTQSYCPSVRSDV